MHLRKMVKINKRSSSSQSLPFLYMKKINVLYNDTFNVLFMLMWHQTYDKRHTQRERKPAAATWVLLYASFHRHDYTYHGLWYTSCGAQAGMRTSSMGPPWRIDPTTISNRSYQGTKSCSCFYISIWSHTIYAIFLSVRLCRVPIKDKDSL